MHPFAKPREYTRAVTAAKMDRMFAKPFVGSLGGHQDGVYCLGKDPRRVSVVAAGGGDGEVIVHSLSLRRPLLKIPQAHKGMVGGVCWTSEARDGRRGVVTCGKLDGTVKIWKSKAFTPGLQDEGFQGNEFGEGSSSQAFLDTAGAVADSYDEEGGGLALDEKKRDKLGKDLEPTMTYTTKSGFNGLDHHRDDPIFATASNTVQIWDEQRTAPVSTLQFGSSMETVSAVKFNQSETSVLASVGGDRTLCLYDIRTGKAERRIVMQVREAFLHELTSSSAQIVYPGAQRYPLSCFSVRRITICTRSTSAISTVRHKSTRATSVVSWAATGVGVLFLGTLTLGPTGEGFASGSYDRTVRLWDRDAGKSRDVYHTKRMQR